MKCHSFLGRVLVFFASFLMIVFAVQATVHAKSTFKLGHIFAETMPVAKAAVKFADEVKKRTDGNIEINIYPASQLGNVKEIFGSHKMGAIEMSLSTYPVLADVIPEYAIYNAGFLFRNWEHQKSILEAPQFAMAWNQRLIKEAGLRIIYSVYYGVRHLTTTNKPVYRPADLKGMKIRAVPNPISMANIVGMGGTPTPVPFAEVFNALRQGVVDGQENPLPSIWSMKFHEVQKYLMLTGHQVVPTPCLISEKVWQELPDKEKRAMTEAGKIASSYGTQMTIDVEGDLLGKMKKHGITVIGKEQGLDIDAFRENTRKVLLERVDGKKWPKGLYEEVRGF